MKNSENMTLFQLKEMIKHCQEIQKLLKDDQENFSKNKLNGIEQSNQNKLELINKITHLFNEINHQQLKSYPGNFLDNIQKEASKLDITLQQEFSHIIKELKTEITKCYQCIMTNNSIVFSNIRQLKDLWDKLTHGKSDKNHLYDHTGNTIK